MENLIENTKMTLAIVKKGLKNFMPILALAVFLFGLNTVHAQPEPSGFSNQKTKAFINQEGVTIAVAENGSLSITSGVINLQSGWPVIDGTVYSELPYQIKTVKEETIRIHYTLNAENIDFIVEIGKYEPYGPYIHYEITGIPGKRNYSNFGLQFNNVAGVKRFYRSGNNSWDGSYYVQLENLRSVYKRKNGNANQSVRGYAMSQLIPRDGTKALNMGFNRHDRFIHTFTLSMNSGDQLQILTHWDYKTINGNRKCESDKLVLFAADGYETGLKRWARLVAKDAPESPRTETRPIRGWSSWYHAYHLISEAYIMKALNAAKGVVKQYDLPLDVFQIDAGHYTEKGDWLKAIPEFPDGIKPVIKKIKDAGFIPGIWISPFGVGNRSELFSNHPEWVLHDKKTGKPKTVSEWYGEHRLWAHRSEEYYVLDITHPKAFEYIRNVFRTYREDWGVRYFKTDFMLYGMLWDSSQVKYHQPGLSRAEIFNKMLRMIREEIGEESIWLGCGQPLWQSVGYVDAIRIGGDIGVKWESKSHSAQSLLRDQQSRNFTNHILWQIDPDCILFRDQYHYLSDTEIKSLAIWAGMSGGVMMTSDLLSSIPEERIDLWKMFLTDRKFTPEYPLLGKQSINYVLMPVDAWTNPRIERESSPISIQVLHHPKEKGKHVINVFNTSGNSLSTAYTLSELGVKGTYHVWDWNEHVQINDEPVNIIRVSLKPHENKLLFLQQSPFENEPEHIMEW